jgi:hypothetical protein
MSVTPNANARRPRELKGLVHGSVFVVLVAIAFSDVG